MNKNTKRSAILILISLLFTVATIILRTVAAFRDLEDNLIYYGESGLAAASVIISVVGAVLLISLSFTLRREDLRAQFTSSLAYLPTGLVGAVLLFFSLNMFSEYIALEELSAMLPSAAISSKLALAVALASLVSIAHFALNALIPERHAKLRAYFAIATLLAMCLYAAFLYFNTTEPINSPNKLYEQMAYLFAALFFIYETRISLGREMWRAYIGFGSAAALLTASAGIPSVILYLAKGTPLTNSIESAVLLVSLFLFILLKMCLAAISPRDEESPDMAVLRTFAEERMAAIENKAVEDGTQISIEELFDIPDGERVEGDADGEASEESAEDAPIEEPIDITTIEWTED